MNALINVEAEAELLGALMSGHAKLDRIADLVASADFYEPTHARIFEVVSHQALAGKSVSPIAVKGFLEGDEGLAQLGGNSYLARLTSQSYGISSDENAKMLAELASRRRMADGLRMAAADCADLTITTAEIVAEADAAISVKSGDLINQVSASGCVDALWDSHAQGNSGVRCGKIPAIDALLGPMKPKQLIIGAGRPGMGKTAMAVSYGLGAASNGHGVLFVSLEMGDSEIGGRMVADMCYNDQPVPYPMIRDGDLSSDDRHRALKSHAKIKHLPFEVIDTGSLTVGRLNMLIRRHARRMAAAGNKLELVIVDYLQLLSPDSKGKSNYEAVSEVSRSLKAMAKDNGVAILALAQLSREVEKRPGCRPQLSDLRDSGQIEQDADAVLFLLRTEYYLRQLTPQNDAESAKIDAEIEAAKGRIEFILAKRRNGETGSAMGEFHGYFQAVR